MTHPILQKWDNGDTVWTIEMGGLGPSYEQALQMAAIECLRELDTYSETYGDVVAEVERLTSEGGGEDHEDGEARANAWLRDLMSPGASRIEGLSGAQAGAAMQLAYSWYRLGEEGLQEEAKRQGVSDDRLILVGNDWPRLKEEDNG